MSTDPAPLPVVETDTWPPRPPRRAPIDLDYRYSYEQLNESISYRTGADPVVIRYHDAYYLFATLAPGYWMSTDLAQWRFVKADTWPLDQPVAAAVAVIDDKVFLTPS